MFCYGRVELVIEEGVSTRCFGSRGEIESRLFSSFGQVRQLVPRNIEINSYMFNVDPDKKKIHTCFFLKLISYIFLIK